ncbi:MAG TPA: extracellular solute-binding protein, partial [Candidatus Binatia bacterium]
AQDMITRGKYPMLVGPRSSILSDALRRKLPIQYVDPSKIKEGSDISPGPGAMALMNRAPHPNAAKVYINWLLTKDGQYGYGKILGYVSNRLDVPGDYYADELWRVPQKGAIKTYDQAAIDLKDDLRAVLDKAFGKPGSAKRR